MSRVWLQANGVWGQLTALKKVVTEPKGTGEALNGVMKEYYGAIRKGQGGLFMAVCRGKVSSITLLGLYISHHCIVISCVTTVCTF